MHFRQRAGKGQNRLNNESAPLALVAAYHEDIYYWQVDIQTACRLARHLDFEVFVLSGPDAQKACRRWAR